MAREGENMGVHVKLIFERKELDAERKAEVLKAL